MANGHVEIHDPFANDGESSPDADGAQAGDTVEFRLLMVYNQRRRPAAAAPAIDGPGRGDPQTPEKNEEAKEQQKTKKKKKRGGGGLFKMCSCMRPRIKSDDLTDPASNGSEPMFRCRLETPGNSSSNSLERDELEEAAGKLMDMASEISFAPPDIEPDSHDDVEKVIALLLRKSGDKLHQEMKDCNIAAELFGSYFFYEKVMKTLLRRMGLMSSEPEDQDLGPKASPKVQIAVTCEATSRLLTLTSAPQRTMLLYGARYLQDYFSPWVTENGGYAEAFHDDDDDDEKDVD